jgi:hypothetical protein
MSAMGHEQTSRDVRVMSALPSIADINQCGWDVRKVPIADIGRYSLDGFLRFCVIGQEQCRTVMPVLFYAGYPYDARVSRAVNDQFQWHLCPLDREFNVQHQLR